MSDIYLYDRVNKQNADYNVFMAFPGCKAFALSSLGYLYICKMIDTLDFVNFEPLYSDTEKTKIMPQNADLIGFSFSFDLDFLEAFKIMDKLKYPLYAKDRGEDFPLIFGGGPVLTANPMPYADFFDFITVGDGEDIITETVKICRENKDKPKSEILKILSEVEGVYVPSLNQNVVKKQTKKLSECIYTSVLSDESFFKNTFIMEIARGCYNRCGFCIASYLNLPIRFVKYEDIINCIELGLKYTNKIALLGALIGAHPQFDKICEYILNKTQTQQIELTVSSLRANLISPFAVKTLVACGQKHSTIAIEAASERLRKVINKNLTEEQIINSIGVAKENGLKGLKIYCMLGLPTETDDDVNEFLTLAKKLKQIYKGFDLSYSFSSFVPKPHTPFQWCGREDTKSIEKKQNYLKKEFHKLGIEASFSSAKWDYYQTVTSRGGRELSQYLVRVYELGGNIGAFKNAYKELQKAGKLPEIQTYTDELSTDAILPWSFIEVNPKSEFLKAEHEKLLKL